MKSWPNAAQRVVVCNLIAIALVLVSVGLTHAALPDPAMSICPTTVWVADDGSCCFDVTVRNSAGLPIPGAVVVVDFGTCVMTFCPPLPPVLSALTNATGVAHFCICATVTEACTATIVANGIVLCSSIPVVDCHQPPLLGACCRKGVACFVSPYSDCSQTGDLWLWPPSCLPDPCPPPVPTESVSWGRVKRIYR